MQMAEPPAPGCEESSWRRRTLGVPGTRTGGSEPGAKRRGSPSAGRGFFLGRKPSSQFNKRAPMPLGSLGHLFFKAMKAFFKASARGLSFFLFFFCKILGFRA